MFAWTRVHLSGMGQLIQLKVLADHSARLEKSSKNACPRYSLCVQLLWYPIVLARLRIVQICSGYVPCAVIGRLQTAIL